MEAIAAAAHKRYNISLTEKWGFMVGPFDWSVAVNCCCLEFSGGATAQEDRSRGRQRGRERERERETESTSPFLFLLLSFCHPPLPPPVKCCSSYRCPPCFLRLPLSLLVLLYRGPSSPALFVRWRRTRPASSTCRTSTPQDVSSATLRNGTSGSQEGQGGKEEMEGRNRRREAGRTGGRERGKEGGRERGRGGEGRERGRDRV